MGSASSLDVPLRPSSLFLLVLAISSGVSVGFGVVSSFGGSDPVEASSSLPSSSSSVVVLVAAFPLVVLASGPDPFFFAVCFLVLAMFALLGGCRLCATFPSCGLPFLGFVGDGVSSISLLCGVVVVSLLCLYGI